MNYNEEMADFFKSLNLDDFELRQLTDDEKATFKDWDNHYARMALKDAENTKMINLSNVYSQDSSICQNEGKQYTLNRRYYERSNN